MNTGRPFLVAGGVVLLHVGGVWALQSGLAQRIVINPEPQVLMAEFVEPERPHTAPPPPPPPPPPPRVQAPRPVHHVAAAPAPAPRRAPAPRPVASPDPAPAAPVLATAPPAPLPPIAAPVADAAPPAPPVVVAKAQPSAVAPAPVVVLPSTDADYLQNEKPAYPALSRKKREQGKVVVGVLIGPDGTAQKAHIHESSGFERLDQAALATVQRWRYVPGKKGGVATAMWFNVPIDFVLE